MLFFLESHCKCWSNATKSLFSTEDLKPTLLSYPVGAATASAAVACRSQLCWSVTGIQKFDYQQDDFWNPSKEGFWNACKEYFWNPKKDAKMQANKDFEIHAMKTFEIHAKKTFENQRRMLKSKQGRIWNPSKEGFWNPCKEDFWNIIFLIFESKLVSLVTCLGL